MSKQLTKRQLQALETKERLHSSAVELYKNLPHDEITIKDICEKAGVSVGVFYHYYESKSEIFFEGYKIFDTHLIDYMEENSSEDPLENVQRILDCYMDRIYEMGDKYRRAFLRVELANQPEYILNYQRPLDQFLMKFIAEAIDEKQLIGEVHEIFSDIIRVTKGIQYSWALYNGNFDYKVEVKKMYKIILKHYMSDK